MKPPFDIELVVGLLAVILSTAAFLLSAYFLGVLALVMGAISFGILVGNARQ